MQRSHKLDATVLDFAKAIANTSFYVLCSLINGHRILTYDDFIAELNKSGLSVKRFAELMGMKPNSISNNKKRGEVPSHLAIIAGLLAEMSARQVDFEPVFARLSPNPKKPRGAAQPGRFAGDKQGVLELGL